MKRKLPVLSPEEHLPLLTEGGGASLGYRGHKYLSQPSDLVQGALDLLLLKVLALEPMNGFAVSQRLKRVSGDGLQVSNGSLYPALHKLEQEGWITAGWKTSEHGRCAKDYSLTRREGESSKKKQIAGAGFRAPFRG